MDLHVVNHGSVCLLTPVSEMGREWIDIHVSGDALLWGRNSTVVEPRYIVPIVEGAMEDGLEVEIS